MTEATENKITKQGKTNAKTVDYSKGIFARYHNKLRDEIEFSETDFYEDNIYDEPEYWRTPRFKEYNDSRHEIRP